MCACWNLFACLDAVSFFLLFILRSRKSSLFLQSFRGNLMPEMHYAWERETLECCCCRYIYIKRKLCKLLSYSVAVYFFILRSKCKTFAVSHHWATWACLGPVDISFNINRQKIESKINIMLKDKSVSVKKWDFCQENSECM